MNCKPGDLAVVVRSVAGNEGKIVRCVRLISLEESHLLYNACISSPGPVWELEHPINFAFVDGRLGRAPLASDTSLRPIRNNDGEDETLSWARPHPSEVGQKVDAAVYR